MTVQTYLFFNGNCEEAIQFYTEVFDANVVFLMRFKDGPAELVPVGGEELVFHATLRFGETTINMCDLAAPDSSGFGGFALLTHFEEVDAAERVFRSLSDRGAVAMPLEAVFWATRYGIVKDRFGVTWKIQVSN